MTRDDAYRAELLATARAAAVPVATQVLADLPPDELAGMGIGALRALVVVLAAAVDMPRLRDIAAGDDPPADRPETAFDLVAPDWDDAGWEFRREADTELADLPPARALVLWQCQELTDRAARPAASEPAGAAA